jgi:Domain of unknown function DUF11
MLVASRTTISDPLPAGVTLIGVPSGTGWSCIGTVGASSFVCTRDDGLAAGAFFPTITVPVNVVSQPTYLTNTATLSNVNDPSTSNNTDPAVINVTTIFFPAFDLSIKKYIGNNDAQPGSPVVLSAGSTFTYVLRVRNE